MLIDSFKMWVPVIINVQVLYKIIGQNVGYRAAVKI